MGPILVYCLKLSISLALVSLFYHFVLRKLTFYNWNRYYFLAYSLLSFYVPFIDISPLLQQGQWQTTHVVKWIPPFDANEIVVNQSRAGSSLTISNVLAMLVITGAVVMGVRLLIQFISLKRLTRKAELMLIEGIRFYNVSDFIIPFSFGNCIFINAAQHSEDELKEIIRHEFVHVKHKHSIDIIWAEIICLLNWYNPFAWLLKRFIRQNLEFIADSKVLHGGINKRQYQYLLLKVVGDNQFSVASKFNFSSLKKRIAMMNKSNSSRLNLVRFLFILPLVIVLLLAFRNTVTQGAVHSAKNDQHTTRVIKKLETDTIPKSSKMSQKGVIVQSNDYEITDDRAVIHLLHGATEEYDLKNKEQRQRFENKYGKIINTSVHKGTMTTMSVITTDGAVTTVAPVAVTIDEPSLKVITAGSGKGFGNGSGQGVIVNNNTTAVATVTTANENMVSVNADVPATTVVAPTALSKTAVAISGEDGNLIAITPEVLFAITRNTTQQQLEDLRKQMKEKGFELGFNDIKYNAQGKLVSIAGTIESKDATARFASSTLNKLIVSVINDGNHIYFRIDEVQKHVI
jgi:BlaR1 peptidase M56